MFSMLTTQCVSFVADSFKTVKEFFKKPFQNIFEGDWTNLSVTLKSDKLGFSLPAEWVYSLIADY